MSVGIDTVPAFFRILVAAQKLRRSTKFLITRRHVQLPNKPFINRNTISLSGKARSSEM